MDASTFLTTLSEEVLSPWEYSDMEKIGGTLSALEDAINCFEAAYKRGDIDKLYKCPKSDELASLLLGIDIEQFRTQREMPWQIEQLRKWKEWLHGERLRGVVVGLLLAEAHESRGRRRRNKFAELISAELEKAISKVDFASLSLKWSYRLKIGDISRNFDFAILKDNVPLLAVVVIFQTRTGGRQQDIFLSLPNIQNALAAAGVSLLVVADGPGLSNMTGVVERVAPQLDNLTNLKGILKGELDSAINRALSLSESYKERGTKLDQNLSNITTLALKAGKPANSKLLGVSNKDADAFFIRYKANHADYAFAKSNGGQLRAESSKEIAEVNRIFETGFDSSNVGHTTLIEILSNKLGFQLRQFQSRKECSLFGLVLPELQLNLPNPLPVFVLEPSYTQKKNETFELIESSLSHGASIARLALLIDPFDAESSRLAARKLAAMQRSHVAVVDREDILEMLLRNKSSARNYLTRIIIREVDLSIVSPFVSEGPTPSNMFFGREQEIKRVFEQIRSQSFGFIGGRKVGKTSMLQRLNRYLPERFPVYYVDCQAHPDRQDFLDYIDSLTPSKFKVSGDTKIALTERVLRAFIQSRFKNDFGVLLFDEVDDLFNSDSQAKEYPHVLSRALRSISQSKTASLIATGERTLFALTADPSSPHWNFCTPIKVGPLSVDASRHLLSEPLKSLGVEIMEAALNESIIRTARHPNLLQFLGNLMVESITPASKTGRALRIDSSMVIRLSNSIQFRNRFVKTFLSQSTPLEKLISIELNSSEHITVDTIFAKLLDTNVEVTPAEIYQALSFLELYFIAKQDEKGYVYTSQAFDIYFSPLASTLIAQQWKEEFKCN
jgi:hypothetical protein